MCVTGRHDPQLPGSIYIELNIDDNSRTLADGIDHVVAHFPAINTLIYAAGFCQRATVDELSDEAIARMMNVGLLAPMLLVQRLKNALETPLKVMLITSSSQYTPREAESVYCATKSGLGMFGASLVMDKNIGKVLVLAPSGMKSSFWRDSDVDVTDMLDTQWVANQMVELSSGTFKHKYAKILRNPERVVIEECINNNLEPM